MHEFDFVVLANGFDVMKALSEVLSEEFQLSENNNDIVKHIDHHLRLPNVEENIHVPGLSTLAQGPGFANLSSLHLVAARIISHYLPKE